MRILCLHGTAINATIFQSKIAKSRSFLPPEYSYDFFEGDVPIIPQKSLADVFPGPYLTWVDVLTPQRIARALSRIEEFIDEEGPFDGVLGVSEGSMISASLILKHQIEKPFSEPLFRFAIFISGTPPFTWSSSVGQDVFNLLISENPLSTTASEWQRQVEYGPGSFSFQNNSVGKILTDIFPTWKERRQRLIDIIRDPGNAHLKPRCFHPDLHHERINIPTAHVWGSQDVFRPHAVNLFKLCDPTVAAVYEHDGEHDVPHSLEDSRMASETIQKTILRSKFAI
ncbi:Serine hydrolase FSH [Elaphomyces granulatus]